MTDQKKTLLGLAAAAALGVVTLGAFMLKSKGSQTEETETKKVERTEIVAVVGDVGGTNVRLSLIRLDLKTRTSTVVKPLTKIASQSVASFEEALRKFLTVSIAYCFISHFVWLYRMLKKTAMTGQESASLESLEKFPRMSATLQISAIGQEPREILSHRFSKWIALCS